MTENDLSKTNLHMPPSKAERQVREFPLKLVMLFPDLSEFEFDFDAVNEITLGRGKDTQVTIKDKIAVVELSNQFISRQHVSKKKTIPLGKSKMSAVRVLGSMELS